MIAYAIAGAVVQAQATIALNDSFERTISALPPERQPELRALRQIALENRNRVETSCRPATRGLGMTLFGLGWLMGRD